MVNHHESRDTGSSSTVSQSRRTHETWETDIETWQTGPLSRRVASEYTLGYWRRRTTPESLSLLSSLPRKTNIRGTCLQLNKTSHEIHHLLILNAQEEDVVGSGSWKTTKSNCTKETKESSSQLPESMSKLQSTQDVHQLVSWFGRTRMDKHKRRHTPNKYTW